MSANGNMSANGKPVHPTAKIIKKRVEDVWAFTLEDLDQLNKEMREKSKSFLWQQGVLKYTIEYDDFLERFYEWDFFFNSQTAK